MSQCYLWEHPLVWLLKALDVGEKGSELTLLLLVIAVSPRSLWGPEAVLTWLLRAASIPEQSCHVLHFQANLKVALHSQEGIKGLSVEDNKG